MLRYALNHDEEVAITDQERFGMYLKRLRESKGLSVRQAAKEAGVSSGYLSQIEGEKRGKRRTGEQFAPHPQILKQLALAYHVPPQDLFERAGYFEREREHLGFPEERETDRCFEFVIHDPALRKVLTTADKKAIVDRYETLSGHKLITWAGENSLLYEKPGYKGLQLFQGHLYAETGQITLAAEEVAQELGITLEEVKTLIEHGHLRISKTSQEKPVIEKAEVRSLKEYSIEEGLKLLLLRYRKDMPQTPKDYQQAKKDIQDKEFQKIEDELKKQKKEKSKAKRGSTK